jgi:acetyl esterase/lipase
MKLSLQFENSFLEKIALMFFASLLIVNVSFAEKVKKKSARRYPPKMDGAEVITYKTIDQVKLNLYLFKPDGHSSKDQRPAIVFFFGGGWRAGTPKQFEKQCQYFASRGIVAITADYRVLSRHGTKAIQCVEDAKSAIRWIRKNAKTLGVNPIKIVASGGSAGGHIAACSGVIDGMEGSGEDTSVSSKPNAMVLFNPALAIAPINGVHPLGQKGKGLEDRVGGDPESISPYHHIKKGQPPTIIFFGTDDRLLKGAEYFMEASKKVGNRCELLTWEGLPHGFFNYGKYDNKPYIETVRAADVFLESMGYLQGEPTINIEK